MSGNVNSAFENNELAMLESGYLADETMKGEERKNGSTDRQTAYNATDNFILRHRNLLKNLILTVFNLAILIYFVFATIYWTNYNSHDINWCNGYGLLILLLVIIYGCILYGIVSKRFFGRTLDKCTRSLSNVGRNIKKTRYHFLIKAAIYTCVFVAIIVFLVFDTVDSRERLMSGIGIVTLLCLGWIFSKHPGRVNWRPVLCGLIVQFIFGLFTIRWTVGRAIFKCFADKVETFLNFATKGAVFVFGEDLVVNQAVFAFSALSALFYFSFFIQILYYLNVMQWIILKLGRVLQMLLNTTICESVTCAANIFIGMSESPLVIKPYLSKMTASELHTVMCSGFATVSGTVLAAYIKFGANPTHLITATLMAAPAALCFSKLFYPETEKVEVTADTIQLVKSEDTSLMDAACKGAVSAIPLVLGIIANMVAFVSFIALVNSLLSWIGSLVGFEELTLEFILSRVFMPLSWIMGVPWEQCEDVGTLIGLKTAVNEFVAYQKLGEFKKAGKLSGRTEAIATFAICGFSNPGSVGITMSMLPILAPEKKHEITSCILRAFVAGSAVTFLTASTAGLLVSDDFYSVPHNGTSALHLIAS